MVILTPRQQRLEDTAERMIPYLMGFMPVVMGLVFAHEYKIWVLPAADLPRSLALLWAHFTTGAWTLMLVWKLFSPLFQTRHRSRERAKKADKPERNWSWWEYIVWPLALSLFMAFCSLIGWIAWQPAVRFAGWSGMIGTGFATVLLSLMFARGLLLFKTRQ